MIQIQWVAKVSLVDLQDMEVVDYIIYSAGCCNKHLYTSNPEVTHFSLHTFLAACLNIVFLKTLCGVSDLGVVSVQSSFGTLDHSCKKEGHQITYRCSSLTTTTLGHPVYLLHNLISNVFYRIL